MNRILFFFFVISLFFYAGNLTSSQFVIGGSNLPLAMYDEPRCYKPLKPREPYSREKYIIDSYNRDVDRYNNEMRTYIFCIKRYVENARYDIQRIEGAIDAAIEEAKRDY